MSQERLKTKTFMILLIKDFLAKDLNKNIAESTSIDFIILI